MIYSDDDLKKMSKEDLRCLLSLDNKYVSKSELINMIKKTNEYLIYNKKFDEAIDNPDVSLVGEQKEIYKSLFLFLLGVTTLNLPFIPDINNLIVSKISYANYPKSNNKIGLLTGGAGTGKTHVVSHIISKLSDISTSIVILAPTNKALKVIKNKIYTTNVNFYTISKFLDQGIEYSQDGKVMYRTKINTDKEMYQKIKYIFIDEASMISKSNWKDLTSVFNKLNVKVLLIGDECQLPPINEPSSVVFTIFCKKFVLTKIVRTKSKEISNIYESFRNGTNDFKYINSKEDIHNYQVITYSNDSVTKYNEIIRNILFSNPEEEYVIGEKLIFGTSAKIINMSEIKYVYANDEAIVLNVRKKTLRTTFINKIEIFPEETFEVYELRLALENGEHLFVYKIQEHDIDKYNEYFTDVFDDIKTKKLDRENMSKLWDLYYTVKNTINTPIQYSYALTVYKSQGSTFNNIFVDVEDISICVKDKHILQKSLYTAVSRGSEKICCYKPSITDYYSNDLIQFPYLKKHNKIDNKKVYDLKDGQAILYTRNEYQQSSRKIVKGKIVHIINKKICVGNGTYVWDLRINDDVIVYI